MTQPAKKNNFFSPHFALPPDSHLDKKLVYFCYFLMVIIVAVSTYLHHFQPQVLRVPSNTNVDSWKNPTFEQTAIYDRMTEAERQQVRSEGLPAARNIALTITIELLMIFLSLLAFRHAKQHYGFWMASFFFVGSFVFTGLEESIWILFGRFFGGTINMAPGGTLFGSYWFTSGIFWFIETPVFACLAWFFAAYSAVWVSSIVFPKMRLLGRATVGGLLLMVIDLWMDPVYTSPEHMNWVWAKGDPLMLLGIPFYNFIGWFLLIFMFAVIWEKLPAMEKKWGRVPCTLFFLFICIGMDFAVSSTIFILEFGVVGNLMSLLGATQTLYLPVGW